ncbi:unnamed protein product [Caenorhabditis brenneri]
MNAIIAKLLLIFVFIHFAKGYTDLEVSDDFFESYYKIDQKPNNSGMRHVLIQEVFREKQVVFREVVAQMFEAGYNFEEISEKRELSCYTKMRGFEEQRIEEVAWGPSLIIHKRLQAKEQAEAEETRKRRTSKHPAGGNAEEDAEMQCRSNH